MSYTDEQLRYINYKENKHTKLLACAGSGKTRCIIARMGKLLDKYKQDEMLMLTFSRFTRDDFINKIKELNIPIPMESVKTIDSFAKSMVDPTGNLDVSLLSYRLMKYLQDGDLNNNDKLTRIKIVFIDEAQDLNEVQYNIFCLLRDRLNILINMIGDPNQNIYQFRNSSDKYLREFKGEVFQLTKNFRSHLPIVEFSKHLRPFNENKITCHKDNNDCRPVMIFHENEQVLENNIIDLLQSAKDNGINLSEFAILSPTRGRMRSGGKSHGLCFISNILYKAKIKFKQFYEESFDESGGVKYSPVDNHVNVLTFMGSKGLEWNYVIIIDADACLINKCHFTENKHEHDRYLLYVACSRAIKNMFIFSKCYFKEGTPKFTTNPWFNCIPRELYDIDDRFSKYFFFPDLLFTNNNTKDTNLNKLIDRLEDHQLDEIYNIMNNTCNVIYKKNIHNNNYSSIEKESSYFLSKYTDKLFHTLYCLARNIDRNVFQDLEDIINDGLIISDIPDYVSRWYYDNRKTMTWETYNNMDISEDIRRYINNKFDRNKDFGSHIIAVNNYYKLYILNQKEWISSVYSEYKTCLDSKRLRILVFYLLVVSHSMDTHHYYHIKSRGKNFANILKDFSEMFNDTEDYVHNMSHVFTKTQYKITNERITSYIDYLDDKDNIWSVKSCQVITFKHKLYSLVNSILMESPVYNIGFINLLTGEEMLYNYDLDSSQINRIFDLILNDS